MLSDFLTTENIIFNMESSERDESLAELLEVLLSQNDLINRNVAMDALIDRENTMSTAVFPHIAVPHAVCKSIGNTVVAVGISRKGIPFESIDENDPNDNIVNIIFEILFDESDSQNRIHILRDILKLISNMDFLNQVMKTANVYEVLDLIRAFEE